MRVCGPDYRTTDDVRDAERRDNFQGPAKTWDRFSNRSVTGWKAGPTESLPGKTRAEDPADDTAKEEMAV